MAPSERPRGMARHGRGALGGPAALAKNGPDPAPENRRTLSSEGEIVRREPSPAVGSLLVDL